MVLFFFIEGVCISQASGSGVTRMVCYGSTVRQSPASVCESLTQTQICSTASCLRHRHRRWSVSPHHARAVLSLRADGETPISKWVRRHMASSSTQAQASAAACGVMTKLGYGGGEHLDIKALWCQEVAEQGRFSRTATPRHCVRTESFIPQGVAG